MNISMDDIQTLQDELELCKKQFEQLKKQKIAKNLEKVTVDDKQEELQKELEDLQAKKKKFQENLKNQQTHFKEELLDIRMRHDELEEEKVELQKKLDNCEKSYRKFQDNLLINSRLPQKNINFKGPAASAENRSDDESMDITYTCHIVSGRPYVLEGGQALLTFEDERVTKSVIAAKKHFLELDDTRISVEALNPPLAKSAKFEVNMNISSKKIKISNLPRDISEETMKDKVELAFYKSGIGGAEIEHVDYDKSNNTAYVTYLQNGVAQRVLKRDHHRIMAGEATCDVEMMPCVDIELNKLQMFSAISSRSVLITGIKNVDDEDEDNVQDLIQIHFQKESNGGGEVEAIVFSQGRKLKPIFEEDLK